MTYLGKVVVVTGGEAGIGKAIVQRLKALSAEVISIDVHAKEETDAEGIHHYPCDISDRKQVENVIQTVAERFGRRQTSALMRSMRPLPTPDTRR